MFLLGPKNTTCWIHMDSMIFGPQDIRQELGPRWRQIGVAWRPRHVATSPRGRERWRPLGEQIFWAIWPQPGRRRVRNSKDCIYWLYITAISIGKYAVRFFQEYFVEVSWGFPPIPGWTQLEQSAGDGIVAVEDCQRACDLHKQALSSWNNASANAHGTCHRYRLEPCRRLVDKQFGHPAQNSHKSQAWSRCQSEGASQY